MQRCLAIREPLHWNLSGTLRVSGIVPPDCDHVVRSRSLLHCAGSFQISCGFRSVTDGAGHIPEIGKGVRRAGLSSDEAIASPEMPEPSALRGSPVSSASLKTRRITRIRWRVQRRFISDSRLTGETRKHPIGQRLTTT